MIWYFRFRINHYIINLRALSSRGHVTQPDVFGKLFEQTPQYVTTVYFFSTAFQPGTGALQRVPDATIAGVLGAVTSNTHGEKNAASKSTYCIKCIVLNLRQAVRGAYTSSPTHAVTIHAVVYRQARPTEPCHAPCHGTMSA